MIFFLIYIKNGWIGFGWVSRFVNLLTCTQPNPLKKENNNKNKMLTIQSNAPTPKNITNLVGWVKSS